MVLASLGHDIPEIQLRELCECDDEGTSKSKAVECLRNLGFPDSDWGHFRLEDLEEELGQGGHPIVCLEFSHQPYQHAVVVISITKDHVQVLDPDRLLGGERDLSIQNFIRAWRGTKGLAILIK